MSVTDDERHHESKRSTVTSGNNRCTETSVPNLIHTLRHQRVRQVNRNHSRRERWEWEWMHEGNWRMSNCARPINVLITVHTNRQNILLFYSIVSDVCCLLSTHSTPGIASLLMAGIYLSISSCCCQDMNRWGHQIGPKRKAKILKL